MNDQQNSVCQECGAIIPEGSPAGLCGPCLLKLGLARSNASAETAGHTATEETVTEHPGLDARTKLAPQAPWRSAPPGADPARAIEQTGDQIGRYKLLQKIGEGGCGVVYMAEQEEPVHRRVALKVIKLGMDTKQVIARFGAERQALALMDHPNIAKVLDAGATETGRPYFVMELVRGIRITDYCDQNNVPTGERLKLFAQVCQAIQHAHQKGVIHRDIKPSNILVTLHDGVPVPKVIDFGIAKATQGRLTDQTLFTAFEQFIGTPAYMSPEQAEMSGLDIDTRSDIYSLGVLLYELLVGATPFAAEELLAAGLDQMRRMIREQEPVRPSTRLSTMVEGELTTTARHRQTDAPKLIHLVRGDLDWIAMKCLEKDRTRRYETANGLAGDIQRHLNSEPVLARPPSNAYRFQKFVRRNKGIVTAVAVVAAVLVLGILASAWEAIRATREAVRATREALRATNAEHEQSRLADEARRNLYTSEMNVAFQSWQSGDAERARTLLTNQIARAGEVDLRGWEWRYLWGRSRPQELATLEVGDGIVAGLASSPDGRIFATHGFSIPLQLWDAASLRPLVTLTNNLERPDGYVVAFSRDGNRLLSTHVQARLVQLWDVRERRLLGSFTNHNRLVVSAVFTPDGKGVISTAGEVYSTNRLGQLKLWDASTFEELEEFEHVDFAVLRCDVSSDGRLVAASGVSPVVRIWDFRSRTLIARLAGHETIVFALRFSPDSQFLATGDTAGTVRLWNVGTDRGDWQTNEAIVLGSHGHPINSLVFSPDGQRLVSTGNDHTAKLWDIANQRESATLRGHAGRVWNAAFLQDGKTLATAANDGRVKIWNANLASEDNVWARSTLRGQTGYSADGRFLAWNTQQGITIWDLAKSNATQRIQGWNLAFSPTENRIVVVSSAKRLQVWSLDSFTEVAGPRDTTMNTMGWWSAAFSARGDRLAAISSAGDIHVWAVADWNELPKIEANIEADAGWVIFGRDGESVLSGGEKSEMTLWRIATGERVGTFGPETSGMKVASMSPDGSLLATGSRDTVRLWKVATRRQIAQFKGGSDTIMSLAFSQDGKTVAAGTFDGVIQLWNVASHQQAATLQGHISFVDWLAFSPDGSTLASSSMDNTLRLWKAATREEIARATPSPR
jgi:WD40 repeat protein/serine/threonine protein kinase